MPDVAQKLVNQRNGGGAVHVVVAIDHDLLVIPDGPLHPFDRPVHVLHQERIVQVRKMGVKEFPRFLYCVYASLYEQVGQHGRNPQRGGHGRHRLRIALRLHYPSFFYRHTN